VEKVLLTIAIPTYNGSQFLEETLRSACSQSLQNPGTSVLVLDNASTDDTAEILDGLKNQGLGFTAVRNDYNLDVGRNFEKAVFLATGQYVWLLADDDVLVPGAVLRMMKILTNERPDVVVVNFQYVDEGLTPITDHPHSLRQLRVMSETSHHETIFSGEEAFSKIGFEYIGLVSSNCFRRDSFLDHSGVAEIPEGFDFMYVVPAIMLSGLTAFVSKPLVLFRQYKKRWENNRNDYSDYLKIDWLIIPVILMQLRKLGYSSKLINGISFQRSLSFLWHLNQAKAKGFKVSRGFLNSFVNVNKQNIFLLLQIPLLFFSPNLISGLAGIYNSSLGGFVKRILRIGNPK
jgi:glycosyltransferase involved in cell wall biosynthesis